MKLTKTLGVAVPAALIATLAMAIDKPDVTGKVTGTVVFDGKPKELKPLTISDEQSKGCCADGVQMDTVDRSLVVSKDGGIQNVVLTLTVKGKKVDIPEEPIAIDQSKCRFEPHITIIPAGASVAFLNSDEVSHNIHTYAVKNTGINKTVQPGGKLPQKLAKVEPVKVACDIHPWMNGYIYVTDATDWALSGADGKFTIEGIPPGDYDVAIWHEKLGKAKAKVTVKEDGSSEPMTVKLGEKKKATGRRR